MTRSCTHHQPRTLHVVGLTGAQDAGKDTVGQLLATHCGFVRIAFADALRAEVTQAFGVDPRIFVDRATKDSPTPALALERCTQAGFILAMQTHHGRRGVVLDMRCARSPRQIMRLWGTEWRVASTAGYWLTPVAMRISEMFRRAEASRFVITDVRYQHEADLVRQYQGLLWQIKRPGREVAPQEHSSENDGSAFGPDTVIGNNYDVPHLQQQVLAAWQGRRALEQAA
nr:hypothetical protein [Variovorax boronicumulans]